MNKKFLSAVLFGAFMLGSSVTFTGCIDNDEPAGIEELRGAKAELISAKAAVQRAKAAQEEAKAISEQAKAELEQIKVEIAKIKLAATQDSVNAESAKYKAEADSVAYQAELTSINMQKKIADAQAEFAKALKNLKVAENALTDDQIKYLRKYIAVVEALQNEVNSAAETLESETKEYTDFLTLMDREEQSYMYRWQIKQDSIETQAVYDAAVEVEALAKAAAENVTDTEAAWGEKLAELEAQKEAYDKELADANVAIDEYMATPEIVAKKDSMEMFGRQYENMTGKVWSEEKWMDPNGEFEFPKAEKQAEEEADDNIELEDVVLEYDNVLGMFGLTTNQTIEGSVDYSEYLKAKETGLTPTVGQEETLKAIIKAINEFRLTDNDEAWNEHIIKQFIFKADETKIAYDLDKPMWEKLVYSFTNFYGMELSEDSGNGPQSARGFADEWLNNYVSKVVVSDISNFDSLGYAGIKDAVEVYNAAVEEFNAATDSLDAFLDEMSAKETALSDSVEAIKAKEFEARLKNSKDLKNFIDAQNNKETELFLAYAAAARALHNAEYDDVATAADSAAYLAAAKNYYEFVGGDFAFDGKNYTYTNKKQSEINEQEDLKDTLNTRAKHDAKAAILAAIQAFHKDNSALITEYRELTEVKDLKGKALKKTVHGVRDAVRAFNDNVPFAIYYPTFEDKFYDNFNEEEGRLEPLPCEDINEFAGGDHKKVFQALCVTSWKLFGWSWLPYLVELTEEEMLAQIEEGSMARPFSTEDYEITFPRVEIAKNMVCFGLFGQEKAYREFAQIHQDALDNQEDIDELVAELEGYIKNIYAQIEAFEAEVAEVEKAFWAIYNPLQEKSRELFAATEAVEAKLDYVHKMIGAITEAISHYLGYELDGEGKKVSGYFDKIYYKETTTTITNESQTVVDEEGNVIGGSESTTSTSVSTEIKEKEIWVEVENIESLKEALKSLYEVAKANRVNAQKELYKILDRIEKEKNDKLDKEAEYLADVEKAQKVFDEFSAKLAAAQAALEAAIARIEVDYDPSYEIEGTPKGDE